MDKEARNTRSDSAIRRILACGTLAPWPFIVAVGAVYLFGLAGQWLTAPIVLGHAGLWPFLLMQVVLIAVWYGLHASRLRDAGRGLAPVQGIAVIHVLAIVLLVLVGAFYMEGMPGDRRVPESLLLVRQLVTFSRGADLLTILGLVACAALLIPPAFSIWAVAQPGRAA